MSEIQKIGQTISALISDTEASVNQITACSGDLKQMVGIAKQTMQGTSQEKYQELINQLMVSQKKLEQAMISLTMASASAKSWLSLHVGNIQAGESSTKLPDINPAEGTNHHETNDQELASNISIEFKRPDYKTSSKVYSDIIDVVKKRNIEYQPLALFGENRSSSEIVERLSGGDMTAGSCSSLAFAYAGNRAGFDVLDFRDGKSRVFFSQNDALLMIAGLPEVESSIIWGLDDIECADRLLSEMQPGKEYYLATGQHASIVRLSNGHYEYLELQSASDNGWHLLHDTRLYERFGCDINNIDYPNILIEIDSLICNQEFIDLLGYLNTAECNQNKGVSGYVR